MPHESNNNNSQVYHTVDAVFTHKKATAREADNSSWRKLVIKYEQQRTKPTNMANLKSCIPMLSFLQEQVSK